MKKSDSVDGLGKDGRRTVEKDAGVGDGSSGIRLPPGMRGKQSL